MDPDAPRTYPALRLAVLVVAMAIGFIVLTVRLHRVQIREGSVYAGALNRQSIRRVLLPAPRGRIFDRRGFCLADNRPSYCIALYAEELRQPGGWTRTIDAVDAAVDRLAAELRLPRQITREDIDQHVRKRLPLPLLAWEGIDEASLARFSEHMTAIPGADIYVQPERFYPAGPLAAHVIGYVGRDRPAVTNESYHYYVSEMRGRAGIENTHDAALAGRPGGQLIRVDATGYKHGAWPGREPQPGSDLHLVLDSGLQGLAEQLLAGRRGACVVLDPRNGDVLTLASSPSFDLNGMMPLTTDRWRRLSSDPQRPLFNRAATGTYPPGSTFKPLIAMAALEHGVGGQTTFDCIGYFSLGNMNLRCWSRSGHGPLAMRKAIEQSCNPYFCNLGVTVGYNEILAMGRRFGFGRRTGIDLAVGGRTVEATGLLPDDAWKRRVQGDAWRAGDTANISIGQGQLLVTPLQMALFASALANGGRVYRPRLADSQPVEVVTEMGWSAASLAIVRGGMYDVVQSPTGTGKRAAVPGVAIAGKTGTAEFGSIERRRKHTWMLAFAPFEAPVAAVAVLVEDGESGGLTCAPIVRALMAALFAPGAAAEVEEPVEGAA